MAYQMTATAVTLKAIHRVQSFSNAVRQTFVQHFTQFQMTVCSRSLCVSWASCKRIVYGRNSEGEQSQDMQGAFRKPASIRYVTGTCYFENIPEVQVCYFRNIFSSK